MQTRLIDRADVAAAAEVEAVITAVRAAFVADAHGDTVMPTKTYVDLPAYNGDFRAMPAFVATPEWEAAGLKWVNVHPDNPRDHDLPTVLGTMIYSDPETAFPLAIMDGTELTGRRTGAAAAVATDLLAVEDATSLGLVGAGAQAHHQLRAIATVRPITEVVVTDVDDDRAANFAAAHTENFDVRVDSVRAAGHCDVCSTLTPVEDPLIGHDDTGDHTHINAIGADAPQKHELADSLLEQATIVIDDYEQCTHSGEISVPFQAGRLTDADIDGELGSLLANGSSPRTDTTGVTVFDSTGLAIQDVAAAHVVTETARTEGLGVSMDLLGIDDRSPAE